MAAGLDRPIDATPPGLTRRDLWIAAALAVVVLAPRWPLRGTFLEEYDSANYAFAVHEIDLQEHHPHPPGYIVFIWTARLVAPFVGDDVVALSTVNTLSGAAGAALLYALLRIGMRRGEAALSTLAAQASAQVWFQQTRPLEDSFAFAWMLAAAYPLARAARGERSFLVPGMFLLGLCPGAKQLLAIFLAGLAAKALWESGRPFSMRLARPALAAALGSALWLVPLVVYAGSLPGYFKYGWSQVQWQHHEALVANPSAGIVTRRLSATLWKIWGPEIWALAWIPVGIGAVHVARSGRSLRFLLWVVGPVLAVRFLALGDWTRFSIYYLPFLLALAVVGLEQIAAAGRALASRLPPRWRASDHLERALRLGTVALSIAWAYSQARFILPTQRALHSGRSPVAEAVRAARARWEPGRTILIVPSAQQVILRQAEYYGSQAGFRVVKDTGITPTEMRTVETILMIHAGDDVHLGEGWFGGGDRVGLWELKVPRWPDLSIWAEMWGVGLTEIHASNVRFLNWHPADPQEKTLLADATGSTLEILRPPPDGFRVRLRFAPASGAAGSATTPPARVRVNKDPWTQPSREQDDFYVGVRPDQIFRRRVRIVIKPTCVGSTADGRERVGCAALIDWGLVVPSAEERRGKKRSP